MNAKHSLECDSRLGQALLSLGVALGTLFFRQRFACAAAAEFLRCALAITAAFRRCGGGKGGTKDTDVQR